MRATRLHRLLAGEDGPGTRALPAGEFLHPLPLLAVVVLMVNDHWLKGAGIVTPAVTGKLSDVAGLLFFPLLLTSVADVTIQAAAGLSRRPWNYTLTRTKLALATLFTAGLFTAVKLSGGAARAVADTLTSVGFHSAIVADPTDLLALPMLGVAYWLGTREIRRVPLGRIQLVEARWRANKTPVAEGLRDVVACGADEANTTNLAAGLEQYFETGAADDASSASKALAKLRG